MRYFLILIIILCVVSCSSSPVGQRSSAYVVNTTQMGDKIVILLSNDYYIYSRLKFSHSTDRSFQKKDLYIAELYENEIYAANNKISFKKVGQLNADVHGIGMEVNNNELSLILLNYSCDIYVGPCAQILQKKTTNELHKENRLAMKTVIGSSRKYDVEVNLSKRDSLKFISLEKNTEEVIVKDYVVTEQVTPLKLNILMGSEGYENKAH